jgi:hypothetical protein
MTTTAWYGTWNDYGDRSCVSIEDSVTAFLNEYTDDFDIPSLVVAYKDAINKALDGTGISMHGREFVGPYPKDDDAGDTIREAIESVDLSALAEKYDRTVQ